MNLNENGDFQAHPHYWYSKDLHDRALSSYFMTDGILTAKES